MSNHQLDLFSQNDDGSQEFFTRKRSWSAAKHRIILRYIQSHCYNLGGTKNFQSDTINYVDGFAGEGKYNEGFGIEDFIGKSNFWKRYNIDLLDTDGSPLIALKCAKVFSLEGRVNLRCFFTEADKNSHLKLTQNCQDIGQGLSYKIYDCQAFETALTTIIDDLQGHPTIFFVDTFGVKGLSFQQICLIGDYLSKYRGELFLLFHNRQVARHAGQSTPNTQDPRSIKAAQTYKQNLTNLLGPNSDKDWEPSWLRLKNQAQQFERWALDYFLKRILRESKFRGVASFEIKERFTDTRPQYSIVVCSNHPEKAFGEFLNEFFAEENKLLFYEVDKAGKIRNFLDQEWERQRRQRIDRVKPEIIKILRIKNTTWTPFKEVITTIILELTKANYDLGFLKRPDYREIILEFYNQGIIQAESLGKHNTLTLGNRIKVV